MPQVSAEVWIPVSVDVAFAVSQTTGEARLRWDPFIRAQRLLDADRPGVGVHTLTRSRIGPRMTSRYVSYRPPTSVGMTMEEGPWFFETFGGGWRFVPAEQHDVAGTTARWKYTYTIKPSWLRRFAEPIGQWLLGREIEARIAAYAKACVDPDIVAAAQLQAD